MNNQYEQHFEESLTQTDSELPFVDDEGFTMPGFAIAILVVVLVCLLAWWGWSSLGTAKSRLMLRGSDVNQLEAGAAVVLDGIQVGSVESVDIQPSGPVATLGIDHEIASRLPHDCVFDIGALSPVMPGNIGVTIKRPTTNFTVLHGDLARDGESDLGGRSLADVREALADDSILPASTPSGMYLLIGVAVLVLAVGFGVSWKVASSSWFRYVAMFAAIVGIGLLFAKGAITLEDLREWIEWSINLIRGGGASESTPSIEIVSK
ncbi:MlaD family protein [Aporhodopirellula aestuarii]|uniref:MCE family protein n=1 Tax=Aporhodopirellula aestuarii TaxID=2950107 RepID=A0ABT0UCS5_9BACT|nr:MlaD family protein [Aporhodopirellula aestuarii]MCM2374570.1 MCE family protein [Aporhodopirellula aestuarii]